MRRIGANKPAVKKQTQQPKPMTQPAAPAKMDMVAKAQIDATLAMTEIAAKAIDNPQLTQLIAMLSQPKVDTQTNKRLTIVRDSKGLIEYIDIEET